MYIWHDTRTSKDKYFVCYRGNILFRIPRFIGKLLKPDK